MNLLLTFRIIIAPMLNITPMKVVISFLFGVFIIVSCQSKKDAPIVGKWKFVKAESTSISTVEEAGAANQGLTFTFTNTNNFLMNSRAGNVKGNYKIVDGKRLIITGSGPQIEFQIKKLEGNELILDNGLQVTVYEKT
jgi:hypothetical protein